MSDMWPEQKPTMHDVVTGTRKGRLAEKRALKAAAEVQEQMLQPKPNMRDLAATSPRQLAEERALNAVAKEKERVFHSRLMPKADILKVMLPELNEAQHKWLREYIAQQEVLAKVAERQRIARTLVEGYER